MMQTYGALLEGKLREKQAQEENTTSSSQKDILMMRGYD